MSGTAVAAMGGSPAAGRALVFERNGAVFADSRDVADFFGKRHDNAVRDIRNLIKRGALKFEEGSYTLPETGSQEHPCFTMGRDGFVLLAMGFTGREALGWKLKYIEAFNRMEAELRARSAPAPVAFDLNDRASLLALTGQVTTALLAEREKVAAITAEKVAVEARVIELAPKAAAWSQIANSSGVLTISAVAKENGVGPHWLARFLEHDIRWCFRRDRDRRDKGPLIAYQTYVDRGLLAHKLVEFTRRDGSVGQRDEVRVTPAGAAKLAELLELRRRAA